MNALFGKDFYLPVGFRKSCKACNLSAITATAGKLDWIEYL